MHRVSAGRSFGQLRMIVRRNPGVVGRWCGRGPSAEARGGGGAAEQDEGGGKPGRNSRATRTKHNHSKTSGHATLAPVPLICTQPHEIQSCLNIQNVVKLAD